jgi:hypothetical protein
MAGLGQAFAPDGSLRQVISLDDGDLVEMIGEHPGSQQAGHAAADHQRVLKFVCCHF